MIAGMWWFFTLLMVSSYTASLASFLTTEKPDPHFENLHELVENAEAKHIRIGAKDGGATESFFKVTFRIFFLQNILVATYKRLNLFSG